MSSSPFTFDQPNINLRLGGLVNDLGLRNNSEKTILLWLIGRPVFKKLFYAGTAQEARYLVSETTEEARSIFSSGMTNYLEQFLFGFCSLSNDQASIAQTSQSRSLHTSNGSEKDFSRIFAPFYEMPPVGTFLLSYLTLGFYDFLWIYRHWRHMKWRAVEKDFYLFESDKKIIPFWSAFFSGWYIIGTARRIKSQLKLVGNGSPLIYIWLTFAIFGLGSRLTPDLLTELAGPLVKAHNHANGSSLPADFSVGIMTFYLVLHAASPFLLSILQAGANKVNSSFASSSKVWRMRIWDYVILVFGLLAFVGNVIP